MKKQFLILLAAIALFSACSSDKKDDVRGKEVKEAYIDASSHTNWNYFSFSKGKVVGSAPDKENTEWFKRDDWDIAINRYHIRTNSGLSTTINSKGGVFTFAANKKFSEITAIPSNINFAKDKEIVVRGHGGSVNMIKSNVLAVVFKKNADGSMIMPPVYLKPPVYAFQTADGKDVYKVEFTQYLKGKTSGHIKFNYQLIK